MSIDFAQMTKATLMVACDEYANIAAINAAAVAVDTKDYRRTRAIVLFVNEDAGADTTIAVEHSDSSSTGFAAVPAAALQSPVTADAATFGNLNTAGLKTIALDLQRCRRYVRVQVATALGAATAVSAVLLGEHIETPKS